MRLSLITAPVVAAVVGFGGTIAVITAAATRLGATPDELSSWIAAVCLAQAVAGIILTLWHRLPIIVAWSTPGAVLLASAPAGTGMPEAVGAFLLCGALLTATALIAPLSRLIERIPGAIASALLAGVLLSFVLPAFSGSHGAPELVLPVLAAFLLTRILAPTLAAIAALLAGLMLAFALGSGALPQGLGLSRLVVITPELELPALLGLGLPLYLVTMASQNLPGFAVLRNEGYPVPARSILAVTGLTSLLAAPFGSHAVNLGAIVAALTTGPDVHPDRDRRWPAGIVFALSFVLFAAFGDAFARLLAAVPRALVMAVAGLALIAPLTSALVAAAGDAERRFPAMLTLAVTASGVTFAGIGAPFWGLAAGLLALGLDALGERLRPRT
jgi:benzoate membrane transport protein